VKKDNGRIGYFLAVMCLFNMAANFVHPVTPTIIVDLQLNDYMFGLALAAQMTFNFLFSPFWGKMAGYISSKKVMLVSGLLYAAGQVLFGLARTEMQFLLARMFAGIFCGGAYVAFLTYTVNCSSTDNRGRNLTLNAAMTSVSAAFGYFVGGMIGEVDAYYAVWSQVTVLIISSVLLFAGCRDDKQENAESVSKKLLIKECNPFSAFVQCRKILTRALGFLFLSYGFANIGYIAFEQCFNYYLRDIFDLTSGYNGVIKAALGVISLAANSTLCLWILRRKNTSFYMLCVMLVCTVSMFTVILFDEMLPFIIVNVIFFTFHSISLPLFQNQAAFLGQGKNSNLVMGSFNSVKSFGSIFGSALAGVLYEFNAKVPFVFGFVAFAAAAAMILPAYMQKTIAKEREAAFL